jgi:beta-glucanase (GH16 family)
MIFGTIFWTANSDLDLPLRIIGYHQSDERGTNLTKLTFHRFAISTLCCASATVLIACGGGGGAPADTETSPTLASTAVVGSNATTTSAAIPEATQAPAAPAAEAAPTPFGQDASKYTLSFSEEFNSYNSSLWNDHIWYDSSNATKNYTVEDGKLKIWPQRDANGKFFNRTIDTDGKYYQTYGYFETEAKLPNGKGTWPAFWLLNHDGAAPFRPEIDILEAYSGGGPNSGWSDDKLNPTAYASTVWPKGIEGGSAAGSKTHQKLGDLSAGFHKYAVKWEPNTITFYFDGKEVHKVNQSMSNRMYILLDLWYGSASGNADNTTPTGKGNSYEVNYVRAWQFK